MLLKGYLGVYQGNWLSYGNAASVVGNVPGSLSTYIVGLPLLLWDSPWAPMLLLIALRLVSFLLFDSVLKQCFSPTVRLCFAILYLLNPWFLYDSLIYNPAYLCLFAAMHCWSAFKLSQQRSWFYSFINVLAIGLAMQLHYSWPILAVISLYLFYRKQVQVNWWGVTLGVIVIAASLVPYIIELQANPAIQGQQSDRYIGWGGIHVYPVLKSALYWLRYSSMLFSNRIITDAEFLWLSNTDWLNTAVSYLWQALLYLLGGLSLIVTWGINRRVWRKIKPHWRSNQALHLKPADWLLHYAFAALLGIVVSAILSPIIFSYWHLIITFGFALFPVLYQAERWQKQKPARLANIMLWVGGYFLMVNLVASHDSNKYSYQQSYQQQVAEYLDQQQLRPSQHKADQVKQQMLVIYNILLIFLLPLAMYKLYWPKPGKPAVGRRWLEHFGISPKWAKADIWFHTVSVGEVLAAAPLIKRLKQQQPQLRILLTTTTATGAEQAQQKLGDWVEHRYAPFDLWPCIAWFLRWQQPQRLWIMETELWPNWLTLCQRHNIPVSLINARMSERSCHRYQRFANFSKRLYGKLDLVLAQHQDDAQRFHHLGVDAAKLVVTGSIKYDLADPSQTQQQAAILRPQLFSERPVWIAASTHKGEDELVLEVMQLVRKQLPDSLLILVPRHPERFDQVAELLKQQNIAFSRRSQQQTPDSQQSVYLADTMGEMMLMYGCADVAFIGGSLVKVGGHNYLEAAAMGLPCVAGEYDFNFSDISQQLQARGALKLSADTEQLANWLKVWLSDPLQRTQAGQAGLAIVKQNQGAIDASLKALLD